MDEAKWERRVQRERKARKEAEMLLEKKSLELWELNQELEIKVTQRTEELELALEEAKIASEAKGAFLSNMSHEIRTPLNAIIGFVDIMTTTPYEKNKFDKYLGIIHTSGKNLLTIINQILDYSKIQSGKLSFVYTEIEIRPLLKHIFELFTSMAINKEINYQLNISNSVPQRVKIEEARITQILSNFISNALKFTPNEGNISVEVDYTPQTSLLRCRVIDTGIGIHPDSQEKIFEVFEQEDTSTTREYGGTGLGLPISKRLIDLMNGNLILESIKGEGSTFGFELYVEAIGQMSQVEEQEEHEHHHVEGNILIAEDNAVNAMLVEIILEDYDVEYTIVENGMLAIEEVKNGNYDLVLMDNQMPEMGGIEATKQIRGFNQDIPIVALSANVLESEQKLFLEAGMNDALAKPIDIKAFNKILHHYLT